MRYLSRYSQPIIWLAAVLHAVITYLYSITKLYTYKTSLIDLGTFTQSLWQITQGLTPMSAVNPPFEPVHWLGFHFSPILYLITPIFALWPQAETLLAVQSIFFALTAIILYHAALADRLSPAMAMGWALIYLLNVFVFNAALYEFHEIVFSTFFIACAYWALFAKRFGWFLLCQLLLIATKEHYGLAVAGFGFLWGWVHKDWRRGWLVMLGGLLALYLVLDVIMPHFAGGAMHPMLQPSQTYLNRYSWLNASWPDKFAAFYTLLTRIDDAGNSGILYLLNLNGPTLFLSLFGFVFLAPAVADLSANLLSMNGMQRITAFYHSAPLAPIFIVAAWKGLREPRFKSWFICVIACFSLITLTGWNALIYWEISCCTLKEDVAQTDPVRALLKPENTVAIQQNVASLFAARDKLRIFPQGMKASDTAILHLTTPYRNIKGLKNLNPMLDPANISRATQTALADPDWRIVYWQKPWLVLKRAPTVMENPQYRREVMATLEEMAQWRKKSIDFTPAGE